MKRILIALVIIIFPSLIFAQASVNVPTDELAGKRIYRDIDRLVAAGAVKNIIVGQRPYSRIEVARILMEAEENLEKTEKPTDKMMIYRILNNWQKYYDKEIELLEGKSNKYGRWEWHPFQRLDISYDYLNGPNRLIFNDSFGDVDGHIRPLTSYRSGRHFADGHNYSFETYHWVEGPFFAAYAHPRFQLQITPANNEDENKVFIQELYGKFGWRNFELELGRDALIWGQGDFGGLTFSVNSRPKDMIKISSPYPFNTPIGNIKYSVFLANLGPDFRFPYSYFYGWKFSLQPARWVEWGLNYGLIWFGDNAPKPKSFGDDIREIFGFIPKVSPGGYSNKFLGSDLRVRVPPLSGAELYLEVYFQNNNQLSLTNKLSYHSGIYLPRLGSANNMAIRLDYKHTPKVAYRHNIWLSGLGLSGELMGDPLGPNGDGGYLNFYYDLGTSSLFTLGLAFEHRKCDTIANSPAELRYRGTSSFEHPINKIISARWELGYEKTNDFNFVQGNSQNSFFGGLGLRINLDIPNKI